jgi:3-deoxy-D-manno-octulosonate 8-phosphate phosphatase (KDO 8-P phosphatase)
MSAAGDTSARAPGAGHDGGEARGARDPDLEARLRAVRLLIVDVDGVLTDGGILVDDRGVETKRFHVHDGSAVWLLRRCGIETAIISGRSVACVAHRARDLEIEECIQGAADKVAAFEALRARRGLAAEACAYMGDDVLDVPLMRRVGLGAAPANARPEAKRAARVVTEARGGEGALRELAERILRAQGRWERLLRERYGIDPAPASDAPSPAAGGG